MSEIIGIIIGGIGGLVLACATEILRNRWREKHHIKPLTAHQKWERNRKFWEAVKLIVGLSILGYIFYESLVFEDSSLFEYLFFGQMIALIYMAYAEKTRPHTPGSCALFLLAVFCLTPLFIIPWWALRIPRPWNVDEIPPGI